MYLLLPFFVTLVFTRPSICGDDDNSSSPPGSTIEVPTAEIPSRYVDYQGIYFKETRECPSQYVGPFDTSLAYPVSCFLSPPASAFGSFHSYLNVQTILAECPRIAFFLFGKNGADEPYLSNALLEDLAERVAHGELDTILRQHWDGSFGASLPFQGFSTLQSSALLGALIKRDIVYLHGSSTNPSKTSLFFAFLQQHYSTLDASLGMKEATPEKDKSVTQFLKRVKWSLDEKTIDFMCSQRKDVLTKFGFNIICMAVFEEQPEVPTNTENMDTSPRDGGNGNDLLLQEDKIMQGRGAKKVTQENKEATPSSAVASIEGALFKIFLLVAITLY